MPMPTLFHSQEFLQLFSIESILADVIKKSIKFRKKIFNADIIEYSRVVLIFTVGELPISIGHCFNRLSWL
jgi:hypothetical protein